MTMTSKTKLENGRTNVKNKLTENTTAKSRRSPQLYTSIECLHRHIQAYIRAYPMYIWVYVVLMRYIQAISADENMTGLKHLLSRRHISLHEDYLRNLPRHLDDEIHIQFE